MTAATDAMPALAQKKDWQLENHLVKGSSVIEICCIVIAVAAVIIALRLNHIAKILEENQKREQQVKRVKDLEPLR